MILLSWFPNFHILWVWTREADPGYPCVRGKSDRVIQFVCPGLNVNESHFAHITCQSDKNIPGSQAGAAAAAYYHSSRG